MFLFFLFVYSSSYESTKAPCVKKMKTRTLNLKTKEKKTREKGEQEQGPSKRRETKNKMNKQKDRKQSEQMKLATKKKKTRGSFNENMTYCLHKQKKKQMANSSFWQRRFFLIGRHGDIQLHSNAKVPLLFVPLPCCIRCSSRTATSTRS